MPRVHSVPVEAGPVIPKVRLEPPFRFGEDNGISALEIGPGDRTPSPFGLDPL